MVGFGSALRIAKRSGWERAYLDYETLKLLLSQIEAVYEEEGHLNDGSPRGAASRRKIRRGGDYRDELFLESDSDLAFASSEGDSLMTLSSDEETGNVVEQGGIPSTSGGRAKPFTLSYSHEDMTSDEEEEEDVNMEACTGGSFTRALRLGEKRAVVPMKSKKKNRRKDPATEFFVGALDLGNDENPENEDPQQQSLSLLNTSFQRGSFSTSEQKALLPQSQSSTLYSFPAGTEASSLTPPRDFSGGSSGGVNWMTLGTSVDTFPKSTTTANLSNRPPPSKAEARRNKRNDERKRQRRIRRRRHLAKRKRRMEQRVPRHLRVAHGKARAITERFLGLLRAEVEKVTLFAQSRLGELADTTGSLRFPSYEDNEFGSFSEQQGFSTQGPTGSPYEVLSDGGMHPSASSSEEEHMGGRRGPFPWSDTSEEDEMSESGGKNNPLSPSFGRTIRKTYSAGGVSAVTEHRTNRTSERQRRRKEKKKDNVKKSKENKDNIDAAQRQIAHFEELRQKRPVFQRNDHIVGEDLLLLSAVDEADGYTAVGVELMHVLRFICVNVIAVRKICRKHDRLLANRMLGGYYHRQQQSKNRKRTTQNHKITENARDPVTLGNILSISIGDDSEAELVSARGTEGNKLVGVFDSQIQSLANSTTVQVVSSCLALALSEYEVSHSRANALARLNSSSNIVETPLRRGNSGRKNNRGPTSYTYGPSKQIDESLAETASSFTSYDDAAGPPSTASSVSLTRLRYTVVSIFGLRQAARFKEDAYMAFLSRASLVFPGPVAEGLGGCSRETLDFFVAYNPDVALLLDPSNLHKGLCNGRWFGCPIESVMLSALATASASSKPASIAEYVSVPEGTEVVMNALSITPDFSSNLRGAELMSKELGDSWGASMAAGDGDEITLRLNRTSLFLFTMNYYITHPTANAFVMSTGATAAHSASLIGAASFSAIFSNMFHSFLMSRSAEENNYHNLSFFRVPLIFSAFAPIWGNVLYAVAIYRNSIPMAFGGRLLLGLGSAEQLHRQVVLAHYLPDIHILKESAHLVKSHARAVTFSLLLGTILGLFDVNMSVFGNHVFVPSYASASCLMSLLWFIQWIRLCCRFHEPRDTSRFSEVDSKAAQEARKNSFEGSFSSDSDFSTGHAAETPESIFFRSSSEGTRDELEAAFGTKKFVVEIPADKNAAFREERESLRTPTKETPGKWRRKRGLKTFAGRLFNVMTYNVALPVAFAIIVLVRFVHEIFFTSCALITSRYFEWNGGFAGLFLGVLSSLVLPINFFCETLSRRFDERTVAKASLLIATIGLVIMVNVGSLVYIFSKAKSLFNNEPWSTGVPPYDWIFGIYQYLFGFVTTFVGIAALEGATLSLMSKVAPLKLRGSLINCGSIVTYLGLISRFAGDIQILMVGLSHRLINTDIVNSLVIPLVVACLVASFLVKKHFFFLI